MLASHEYEFAFDADASAQKCETHTQRQDMFISLRLYRTPTPTHTHEHASIPLCIGGKYKIANTHMSVNIEKNLKGFRSFAARCRTHLNQNQRAAALSVDRRRHNTVRVINKFEFPVCIWKCVVGQYTWCAVVLFDCVNKFGNVRPQHLKRRRRFGNPNRKRLRDSRLNWP